MRFRSLRLTAYGALTDTVLDFGERPASDIHIVLGLNEAGKSTMLRAIHALLFGFPNVTRDAFLHPYDKLRVGAVLESTDGERLECQRVKAKQRDLRDEADEPIDPARLRHMLGGFDKSLYQRLFLVDHEELRRGGEGLLAGGGELGVSLFGATLGEGNVAKVRAQLAQEAEALFKADTRARNPRLNASLRSYQEHIKQAGTLAVKPREYKAAIAAVSDLGADRDRKMNEIGELESEQRVLRRLAAVAGPIARHQIVDESLLRLTGIPELEPDAKTRREGVIERRADSRAQLKEANKRLDAVRRDIGKLSVPEALLERGPAIKALVGQLGAHEKARSDRLNRVRELDAQTREVTRLRDRLGSTAPQEPPPVERELIEQVGELGDEHAQLIERRRAAETATSDAERTRDAVSQALADAQRPPQRPDDVERWADAAAGQVAPRLAAEAQARTLERSIKTLKDNARSLAPPFDPDTPPPVQPPTEAVIAAHRDRVEQLASRRAEREAERERLTRRTEEIRTHLATGGADDLEKAEAELAAARRERDQRVEELGELLGDGNLDGSREAHASMPGLLARSDELADSLLSQADKLARRSQLQAERRELERQLKERGQELERIEQERDELSAEWLKLWEPCRIQPLADAAVMLAWRERYQELVAQHADLSAQLVEQQAIVNAAQTVEVRLRAALDAVGDGADSQLPLAQLADHARLHVDRADALIEKHETLSAEAEQCARALANAETTRDQAEEGLKDWSRRWAEVMRTVAVASDATPAEARRTLALLSELATATKTAGELEHRIERIDLDYEDYCEEVTAIVDDISPHLKEREPTEAIRALDESYEAARAMAVERDRLREREDALAERVDGLEAEVRLASDALRRMCTSAGCETEQELPEIERLAAERDQLRRERDELEPRISEQGERSLQALEAELNGRTGDEIAVALSRQDDMVKSARAELESLVADHAKAEAELRQLDHGDEASLQRELAEQAVARAAQLADEHLTARAAEILLTRAIEHHRENSATPIVTRAQELLPLLTNRSLVQLFVDAQPGSDQPVIEARRAGGGELGAKEMSDGTADQLYLALRLAALEHHLDALPPLPLLLDDVLVNFDEQRVASALPALAEVAERTQVILLTHHRHISVIAKRQLSDRVRIHSLGSEA